MGLMYIFIRLTWIDINVVNLVTMHVFIMLVSSFLSRYAQVNKYGDCYDICYMGTLKNAYFWKNLQTSQKKFYRMKLKPSLLM